MQRAGLLPPRQCPGLRPGPQPACDLFWPYLIYNAAALKAIASVPAASRIEILDLYAIVTKECGTTYARCPEGCAQTDRDHGDCYQIQNLGMEDLITYKLKKKKR